MMFKKYNILKTYDIEVYHKIYGKGKFIWKTRKGEIEITFADGTRRFNEKGQELSDVEKYGKRATILLEIKDDKNMDNIKNKPVENENKPQEKETKIKLNKIKAVSGETSPKTEPIKSIDKIMETKTPKENWYDRLKNEQKELEDKLI